MNSLIRFKPNLPFISEFLKICVKFFLFFLPGIGFGQAIGGIPKNTNPKDSGSYVPATIFNKATTFFPLPKGGAVCVNQVLQPQSTGGRKFGQYETVTRRGNHNNGKWSGGASNSLCTVGPDQFFSFCHPLTCGFSLTIPGHTGTNSDTIIRYRIFDSGNQGEIKYTGIVLEKPYRVDFRDHLARRQDQTYVYTLSYNQDTAAIHNEIHVFAMGNDVVWNGQKKVLTGKLLEKMNSFGNNLYILERENTTGTPGNTLIEILDGQLLPITQNLSGLDPQLVQGKIDIFKILPDGKILIAGVLNQNGNPTTALIRLLLNGAEDPSFSKVLPTSTDGFLWDLGQDGRIRMAWIDTSALSLPKAKMALIGFNGGIETLTETALDPSWPVGKAKMYHPDLS